MGKKLKWYSWRTKNHWNVKWQDVALRNKHQTSQLKILLVWMAESKRSLKVTLVNHSWRIFFAGEGTEKEVLITERYLTDQHWGRYWIILIVHMWFHWAKFTCIYLCWFHWARFVPQTPALWSSFWKHENY